MNNHIRASWLDTDWYEFTQGALIHAHHPNVMVEMSFINRSKSFPLGDIIDVGELKEELRDFQIARITEKELMHLASLLPQKYLGFLNQLRTLPSFEISTTKDRQIDLRFYGRAAEVIYWEVPSMRIMKKLFYKSLMKDFGQLRRRVYEAEGRVRFGEKVFKLKDHPNVKFADFGTRRRYSLEHQNFIVGSLKEEMGDQFLGTSNVLLAMLNDVKPIGTNSHKGPMIYSGIFWERDETDPSYSQRQFLRDLENIYGPENCVFLADTWNSDWFFENVVRPEQLASWKGSRHDSSDPVQYANNRILEYLSNEIDPRTKSITFADNMDLNKMIFIANQLDGHIEVNFGWGTDLTCDLGLPKLNGVTKVIRSNGRDVAKISDEPAKATGTKESIERVHRLLSRKPNERLVENSLISS